MISRTTKKFRDLLAKLPADIQRRARKAYERFKDNNNHPGLQFKLVNAKQSLYSARISDDYRVLGVRRNDVIVWLWIGSHDEYEKLLD